MLLALIMIGFGVIGLRGRDFKVVGNRKVRGSTARILGGILMIGGLANLATGFSAVASSIEGVYIGTGICAATLILVMVVGTVMSTTDDQEIKTAGGLMARPSPNDPDYVLCPRCDFEQWREHKKCQKCGAPLLTSRS